MSQFRYIILIVLVVTAATIAVLWQNRDTETAPITFTRPQVDDDAVLPQPEAAQPKSERAAIVPLTEPLAPGNESNAIEPSSPTRSRLTEPLNDEQLAAQIKLAQDKLAQVEALNARKQALVEQELATQRDAVQPLLEAELAYHIGGWRQAWRTGDVDRYFGYYSTDFTPDNGMSVAQWRAQRVKRLNPKQPISLELEDFTVSYDDASQRSLVRFKQVYRSGDYQDQVHKRLILVKEKDQWKILSETVE